MAEYKICPFCHGDKKILGRECTYCNGIGEIPDVKHIVVQEKEKPNKK